MEKTNTDEEKYVDIRQTIRQVILPLVQAISESVPSDIMLFCSQYFENQLKKRESREKEIVDGNLNLTEVYENKKVGSKCIESSESRGIEDDISTNVQGSASDPSLIRGKKCDGVSLRETSSWDIKSSIADGSRMDVNNLADAKCGIGDQARITEHPAGVSESDVKAGDISCSARKEKKKLESDNLLKNDLSATNNCQCFMTKFEEKQVLPSAPSYEELTEKLKMLGSGAIYSENFSEEFDYKEKSNSLLIKDKTTNLISDTLSYDPCCHPLAEQQNLKKDTEICNKQLSPNSSFGFIPYLKDYDECQEAGTARADLKISNESHSERKPIDNISELTEKCSETFQDLALKFSSAESNFNTEFQRAKEISDIIRGSCSTIINDGDKMTMGSNKGYENEMKEKVKESPRLARDKKYINKNSMNNVIENISEYTRLESDDITPRIFCNDEETDKIIRNPHNSLKEDNARHGERENLLNKQNDEIVNEQDIELCKLLKDSPLNRNNINENRSRMDSSHSRPVVDEAWRRRWYEAHPFLNNISNRFQQVDPRLQRGQRAFIGPRPSANFHIIGEAGDLPPDIDRQYDFDRNLAQNEENLESSRVMFSRDTFSPVIEESNIQSNFLAEESDRRESTSNLRCNFLAEETGRKENIMRETSNISNDSRGTKMSGTFSSPKVPYKWRNMSRQQANYLETEKQVLKQLQSLKEEAACDENKAYGDIKPSAQESHALSETLEVKHINKIVHNDVENDQNKSKCNTEQLNSETPKHLQNLKNSMNERSKSAPLESPVDISGKNEAKFDNLADQNDNLKLNEKRRNNTTEIQETLNIAEKTTNSDSYSYSNEYQDSEADHSTNGRYRIMNHNDQAKEMNRCENIKDKEKLVTKDLTPDNKDKTKEINNDSPKVEPGLNAACGDFTSSSMNESERHLQTALDRHLTRESDSISSSYSHHNTSSDAQDTSVEYLGEVIRTETMQESFSDSYDGLDFSSYSEESSNVDSDFSESDDLNLNSKICNPESNV